MSGNTRARICIVGASLAGVRAAQALRRMGHRGPIILVGDEAEAPYSRPPLSKRVLTGEQHVADIRLPMASEDAIEWRSGTVAVALDRATNEVVLATGERVAYDGLIIATGCRPRRLPVPGMNEVCVHVLRTIDDAMRLRSALRPGAEVVVLGAGFVGCEVAASARRAGAHVTVVDPLGWPMATVFDRRIGDVLEQVHRAQDVAFEFGRTVVSVFDEGPANALVLDDGRTIRADVVVLGVGCQPNVEWLDGAGLDIEDGVRADERCLAIGGEGQIAAAGDVARWHHAAYGRTMRIEHWSHAVAQGEAAAAALLYGPDCPPFVPLPSFWSDQYHLKVQVVGALAMAERTVVEEHDQSTGAFFATGWRDGRVIAAIAANRPARLATVRRALHEDLNVQCGGTGRGRMARAAL